MSNIYTPEFINFCVKNRSKFTPIAQTGGIQSFSQKEADDFLNELGASISNLEQLNLVANFARNAKLVFDEHINNKNKKAKIDQAEIDACNLFYLNLEKKLAEISNEVKKTDNNPQASTKTAYKAEMPSGTSFYEALMGTMAYDQNTVGASAMFFLAFSVLKFMLGTRYWGQAAEYTAADPSKRFDANNITKEQADKLLHKKSSMDEIILAGFLPKPTLAHALELEFKAVSHKMGAITKQSTENGPSQLGYNLTNRK